MLAAMAAFLWPITPALAQSGPAASPAAASSDPAAYLQDVKVTTPGGEQVPLRASGEAEPQSFYAQVRDRVDDRVDAFKDRHVDANALRYRLYGNFGTKADNTEKQDVGARVNVGDFEAGYTGEQTTYRGRVDTHTFADVNTRFGGSWNTGLTRAGPVNVGVNKGIAYSLMSVENHGALAVNQQGLDVATRMDLARAEAYTGANLGMWMEKGADGQWHTIAGLGGQAGVAAQAAKASGRLGVIDTERFDLDVLADVDLLKAEAKAWGKTGYDMKTRKATVEAGVDTHLYLAKAGVTLAPTVEVAGVRVGLRPHAAAYLGYGKKADIKLELGGGKLDFNIGAGTSFEFLGIPGGVNLGVGVYVDMSDFSKKYGKPVLERIKKLEPALRTVVSAVKAGGAAIADGFRKVGGFFASVFGLDGGDDSVLGRPVVPSLRAFLDALFHVQPFGGAAGSSGFGGGGFSGGGAGGGGGGAWGPSAPATGAR